MATITRKPDVDGWAVTYELRHSNAGADFDFELHGNDVRVRPKRAGADWRKQLTAQEKLDLFDQILGDYRQRVIGDGGFDIAALGVTTDGEIYITGNAGERQHSMPFHRGCAETGNIKIGSERHAYVQKAQHERKGLPPETFEPSFLEYETMYVMGGQMPDIRIVAPCGDCTETLAKHMAPQARVVMLPVPEARSKPGAQLTINESARFARDLGPDEAWSAEISYLRRLHSVKLDKADASMQREALNALAKEFSQLLRAGVGEYPPCDIPLPQPEKITQFGSQISNAMVSPPQAAPADDLNRYQMHAIRAIAFDRVTELLEREHNKNPSRKPDHSYQHIRNLLANEIASIRHVALQLDNGRMYEGASMVSSVDNAVVPAEMAALQSAARETGRRGVYRVMASEFNPQEIKQGTMPTSPKPGVERIIKRRSRITGTTDFSFTPFNQGNLDADRLERMSRNHAGEELFPGYFTGKKGQAPAAIGPNTYRLGQQPAGGEHGRTGG